MTFLVALLAALVAAAIVPPTDRSRRVLTAVARARAGTAAGPPSRAARTPGSGSAARSAAPAGSARPAVSARSGAGREPPGRAGPPRRLLVAAVAGVGLALVIGGAVGGGGVAFAAFLVLGRLEPAAVARRQRRVLADLPVALDLLAACLSAGASLPDATAVVARAIGGPLGADLDAVVALLRLGGPPAAAWSGLTTAELASVGRTIARAAETGAPLASAMAEAAREQREQAQFAAEERARRAGVYAVAPLGLCFLPAFVLVGVVPVVAGLLGAVLR